MATQEPTPAPDRFVRRLRKAFDGQALSLREVAKKVGISPAYLSRLISGERGLPDDNEIISKLEWVLEVPRGELFDAAARADDTTKAFLNKPRARPLMRSLETLSEDDFAQVLKVAQRLAQKHQPE